MEKADWLVLCALNAELLTCTEDAIDMVMDACRKDPTLIMHLSTHWWAMKYAGLIMEYCKTERYQRAAAERRRAWEHDKLKDKPYGHRN